MEEKNLVTLPNKVADYLESMREKNYTLLGTFARTNATAKEKELMTKFFSSIDNQEKFALAWINGYKREEKFYRVLVKNIMDDYGYLNYDYSRKKFSFSSSMETNNFKTKFTKTFLEENSFGWVLNCEGVELIEVEND